MANFTDKPGQDLQAQLGALYRNEAGRRVLATLIRLLGDFDRAEEALHDAFKAALEQWPKEGMPANPRAWLISTSFGATRVLTLWMRSMRRTRH